MPPPSTKLAPYLEQLEQWLGVEELGLAEVQERLRALGCTVSTSRLSRWWRARQREHLETQLLLQIAKAARECQAVEAEFGRNPAPPLETLIKLHRVLVLKLSTQANLAPNLLSLVAQLMRPVMEWARLQEKQKQRELAEQKYRDELAAQKAVRDKELSGETDALTPETVAKIERELHLF